ncbi:hypothetical protein FACS1894166_09650 [Bacilli bacterium]|nr:hypothetical protein FACS1894166_09650 [Bacilli bacterium]
MNNLITFIELQNKAREFKSTKYFDTIKQYRKCFTGDMILDITKANKVIDKTVNNNSAHHKYFAFK